MCFSTGASFGAGVVLSAIGIASLKKSKTPSQIILASIPLIFAVQQISEGFVWLSLLHHQFASWRQVATYTFLFFAEVLWPVWIPLAILKLEPKGGSRKAIMIFVGMGVIVSLYFAYCLLTFPVEARILGYHISYLQSFPSTIGFWAGFLYIIATIAPSFFSQIRRMWLLGTTILASYIISTIFYTDYVVSVWCFFATLISIVVYIILNDLNKAGEGLFAAPAAPPRE